MKSVRITKRMRKAVMLEMARKGGKNSRKNLTAEQRTALARKAAEARWGKEA